MLFFFGRSPRGIPFATRAAIDGGISRRTSSGNPPGKKPVKLPEDFTVHVVAEFPVFFRTFSRNTELQEFPVKLSPLFLVDNLQEFLVEQLQELQSEILEHNS